MSFPIAPIYGKLDYWAEPCILFLDTGLEWRDSITAVTAVHRFEDVNDSSKLMFFSIVFIVLNNYPFAFALFMMAYSVHK